MIEVHSLGFTGWPVREALNQKKMRFGQNYRHGVLCTDFVYISVNFNTKTMNKKTTLFKSLALALLTGVFTAGPLSAQVVGSYAPLSTGATSNSGVAAPSGYTWSEVQNDTGNTTESNTSGGFSGHYNTAGTISFAVGDDFTVPEGLTWGITGFEFFGYQTGYTGTTIPIDALRIAVYNVDPATPGATPILGNLTANVLNGAQSGDAQMYRIFNSAVPTPSAPGTTRKIWRFVGNLSGSLTAGTYWVVAQVHALNDSSIFFPGATIPGVRLVPGANGKQNIIATTDATATLGWTNLIDGGNPAAAPDVAVAVPFNVRGTVLANQDQEVVSLSLFPNPVSSSLNINSSVPVTGIELFDLTGRKVKSIKGDDIRTVVLSELPSGTYMVNLKTVSGRLVKKIVKQ